MRIIHGAGYSDKDRAEFRVLVYRNIYKGMRQLVNAMEDLKIDYMNPANKASQAHTVVLRGASVLR